MGKEKILKIIRAKEDRKKALAEIVETGPDELSESPRIVIRQGEIHIRNIRPFAGLNVIA